MGRRQEKLRVQEVSTEPAGEVEVKLIPELDPEVEPVQEESGELVAGSPGTVAGCGGTGAGNSGEVVVDCSESQKAFLEKQNSKEGAVISAVINVWVVEDWSDGGQVSRLRGVSLEEQTAVDLFQKGYQGREVSQRQAIVGADGRLYLRDAKYPDPLQPNQDLIESQIELAVRARQKLSDDEWEALRTQLRILDDAGRELDHIRERFK